MALNDVEIRVGLDDNVTLPLKKIESSIIRFVGAISAAIASAQAIAFPLREAAEFEQAMLNVAKTTNFSQGAITSLSADILELSTTLDVAAVDLANIAAIAGQLGLGEQGAAGIAAFTETTARFSSVLDVTVETAAEGLAKISNIFNISLKEAEKISSAFNEVSNTSTASGQALLDIVRRLGNAGGTISLEQSLGLAATGVDFGLTLETIGTSFTKIFSNMQSRAGQFAEFMGTSTEEWAGIVERDGVNALRQYLDRLNQVDSTTRAYTVRTLSGGGRIFSLVNKLIGDAANGYAILGKNIGNAGAAFESGTSSIEEHARVMTGVIAKIKILGNTVTKLATEIGNLSLPFLKDLTEDLTAFFRDPAVKDGFTQLAEGIGEIGKSIVETIKWIADLNINWANLAQILKLIVGYKIAKYFLSLGAGLIAHGAKVTALIGTWTKLGTTIAAVAAGAASGGTTRVLGGAVANAQKATKAYTAGIVKSNEILKRKLQEQEINYFNKSENLLRSTTRTISTYEAQLRRPGANVVAIENRIAGARKAQVTQLARMNVAHHDYRNALTTSIAKNEAFIASQTAMTTAVAKSTGFFGKLFAGLRVAGGALGRLIIGPWGTLALIIGSSLGLFGKVGEALTKLGGFLGFSTKEQQEQARSMRIAAAEAAAQEEKIRGLADAYVQLTKAQGNFKFAGAGDLLQSQGLEGVRKLPERVGTAVAGVNARLKELSINAQNTRDAIATIDVGVAENEEQLAKSGEKLKQAYADLESVNTTTKQRAEEIIKVELSRVQVINRQRDALIEQRKELQAMVADYESGLNIVADKKSSGIDNAQVSSGIQAAIATIDAQLRARTDAITEALKGLDSEQDDVRAKAEALVKVEQDRIDALEEQKAVLVEQKDAQDALAKGPALETGVVGQEVKDRMNELIQIQEAIAEGASAVSIEAAGIALQYREAEDALEGLRKKKEAILNEEISKEDTPEALAQQADQASRLKQTEIDIAKQEALLNRASEARTAFLAEVQKGGLALDAATGEAFVKEAETLEDARDILKTMKGTGADKFISDLTRATIDSLNTNIGWVETHEDVIRSMKRVSEEATRMKDDIATAYKNVDKSIEKLIAPLKELDAELASIKGQRLFDKTLEKDQKFVTDTFDAAIERTRKLKEERIDAARAAGNDRRADALQKDLDRSTALAEAQRDYLNTTKAANAEVGRMNESTERLLKIRDELSTLAQQAASVEKSGDFKELARINEEIQRKRDEAQQINEQLADARRRFAQGDFDVGEGTLQRQAVPDSQLDKITEKAQGINVDIAEQFRKGLNELDKAATGVVAPIVAQYDALAAKAKETETKISTLADTLNLSQSDLTAIRATWGEVGTVLSSVSERLDASSIKEVVGVLQSLDSKVFDRAEAQLDGTAERYARKVENIVAASAGAGIESLEGKEVKIAASMDANEFVTRANAELGKLDTKIQLKGEITSLKVKGDQTVQVNAQENARGGYIAGPGTGTSDSILSWLSNGEYVIDAATTRLFGSGFFRTLQSIARSGANGTKSLIASLNLPGFASGGYVGLPTYHMGIPAFAGGGLVDALDSGLGNLVKDLAVAQGASPEVSERVELALAVGGEQYTVQGSRDQVKGLVDALKDVSRSVRRI